MIKLDYTITSPEERKELVEQILKENPDPTPYYLEKMTDYLVLCMEKQEKKEKRLLTDNRMSTVNKREISYEGLVAQLENGEDGIYNLATNNKNTIFQPKVRITTKDVEEIEPLRQLKTAIKTLEDNLTRAEGKAVYNIKQTLIELRKDQYVIKNAYRQPIIFKKVTKTSTNRPKFDSDEWFTFDKYGDAEIHYKGFSFCDPAVCEAMLCNFAALKARSRGDFDHELYYMVEDFEKLYKRALEEYQPYMRLTECKIDGVQNVEIQQVLQQEFNLNHTSEYISALWRNKIPKIVAKKAEEEYLEWFYLNNVYDGFKRCTRCGCWKPTHNKFFSKNSSSKDGLYSICKKCRNTKKGG